MKASLCRPLSAKQLFYGSITIALTALGLALPLASPTPGHEIDQDAESTHHAHEFSSETHRWTVDGRVMEGHFLMTRDERVVIERTNGVTVAIELERFAAEDRAWIETRTRAIGQLNQSVSANTFPRNSAAETPHAETPTVTVSANLSQQQDSSARRDLPAIAEPFTKFDEVTGLRADRDFLYVESTGFPDHPMMKGITAWQQQVPLPQAYTGNNAWRIPLRPRPAANPLSAKTHFFRGAIALAANGVPIFNPIKNDGRTDTFLAGELDEWGGHCGRGDDYHYHIAPVHLQEIVGEGQPIAFALDGYPLYGYADPSDRPLDEFNGHTGPEGDYHYHATKDYPYVNGGFHGEVTERDGQVDPQPMAQSPRPALPPLRGARIVDWERDDQRQEYAVVYSLNGERQAVRYRIAENKSITFTFERGRQGTTTETYQPQRPRRGAERPPRQRLEPTSTSPPTSQERTPWIEAHAHEMDTNADGFLTQEEVIAESRKAFAGYLSGEAQEITLDELTQARTVRSAMGGFIKQHAQELDRNNDQKLTLDEVEATAVRMFQRANLDAQQRLVLSAQTTTSETPTARPAPMPRRNQPQAESRESIGVQDARRPNFVVILVDDMGWHDVGFMGNEQIETPHLDRLAQDGVWFSQAYAAAPNCAPTRACLLSGQYAPRHGVFTVVDERHTPGKPWHPIISSSSADSLDAEVVTIAELVQGQGYATACFGMWNLGRGRTGPTTPNGQGFDLYIRPTDLGFEQNAYQADDERYLTDELFDRGLEFIKSNREGPFFLYLPTHAIHGPYDPKPELLAKYQAIAESSPNRDFDPAHAATVEALDHQVGRLRALLQELDLTQNTWIIFTSDNGGEPRFVGPLNGSKGALYEGGLRVPLAIVGPDIVTNAKGINEPVSSIDLYPTIAELAGCELPQQPIDGISLCRLLKGEEQLGREALFWHFPCYVGRGEPSSAIRVGQWKLIEFFQGERTELYDLSSDPGETKDLSTVEVERRQELLEQLHQWQTSVNAPRPTQPNPNYDPSVRPQRGGGRAQRDR